MTSAMRFLRPVAIFLGNLVAATIGAAIILESELWHIVPSTGILTIIAKEYVFSALIPFVLGYFVFWKWGFGSAKWVWIAGAVWLVRRAVLYWLSEAPLRLLAANHSVFWELSGIGCNNHELSSCWDFFGYTVPFVRTMFYSIGAYCCSIYRPSPTDLLKLQFWRKPQSQDYQVLGQYDLSETQEGDRIVIEQLQKNGVDLSKLREVKHYLFLPTAHSASQMATELRTYGYEVEERMKAHVGQNSSNPFIVIARNEDLVNLQSVEEMRQRFEKLALDCGGEYDGWEAAALP